MFSFISIVSRLITFYEFLVVAHCILSWLPVGGFVADVKEVIAKLCDPYLSLFRRFIPAFSGIDFSPMVAVLVLELVKRLLFRFVLY